jgi:EmrB/QacA subfamily drug resistance transporter
MSAGGSRRWWVLATMTGSLSMIMIDQTVVGVALPTMRVDLGLSSTGVQWVVNAYLLVFAVLVAVGGRAGDLWGPARMFKLGVSVFVLASVACGLAQSDVWMIVARGLQGVGAAIMVPATGAIVMRSFEPGERGRAMGIYAGASMIFLALGPLIGGVLTQAVSWRAVFFVNVPIGLVTLFAAHFTLDREPRRDPAAGSLDLVGIPLLIAGLTTLVLALMQAQTWGWGSSGVLVLLAVSALVMPVFCWWELRCEDPVVELRLFAAGNFAIDTIVLAVVQFALVGVSIFGAIWVQDALGFGPIAAGVSLLPLTLPLLPTAPLAGRINDRHGSRVLLWVGTLLLSLALGWLALVLHKESYPWLIPGYVAIGIALGLAISPASTDAMNTASPRQRSQASGLTQMMRQVGGTIGLAVLGTVIADHTGAAGTSAATRSALTSATADAYWLAAAVLLPIGTAALMLIRSRPAAAQDTAPTGVALGSGPVAVGRVETDLATSISKIAVNTDISISPAASRTSDLDLVAVHAAWLDKQSTSGGFR